MDLKRVRPEDKLDLCRKYFYGGFFLLPFLWLVNSIWFFRDAFLAEAFDEQKRIRSYVVRSMIGTSIWTAIIATWVTIFQVYRADWGATADSISFIIPKGIP
jgi:presenilin enhancer 2